MSGIFNVVASLVALTIICGMVYHYNERDCTLQLECMKARGNWETREGSREIGCRFPIDQKVKR